MYSAGALAYRWGSLHCLGINNPRGGLGMEQLVLELCCAPAAHLLAQSCDCSQVGAVGEPGDSRVGALQPFSHLAVPRCPTAELRLMSCEVLSNPTIPQSLRFLPTQPSRSSTHRWEALGGTRRREVLLLGQGWAVAVVWCLWDTRWLWRCCSATLWGWDLCSGWHQCCPQHPIPISLCSHLLLVWHRRAAWSWRSTAC